MDIPVKNEWLAELLTPRRDLITEYWIEEIRAEGILGYQKISDEQLHKELPPTVDSMIEAFKNGDTEGPRKHSVGVIQRRLENGFLLPDLQMSLHALQTAVMRIVEDAQVDVNQKYDALLSSTTLYYMVALLAAAVYEQLRAEQQKRFITTYEFGDTLSRTLDLDLVLNIAVQKISEYINGGSAVILLARPEEKSIEVRAYYNVDSEVLDVIPSIYESLSCGTIENEAVDDHKNIFSFDVRTHQKLSRWAGLLTSHRHLSMAYMPLMAKQKQFGSLVILWPEVHNITDSEMNFLLVLANHTASAVQNAILYEEAQGKQELKLLLEASRLFSSSLDTQDILRKIAKMATETVKADLAVVFVLDRIRHRSHHITRYASGRKAKDVVQQIISVLAPEGRETGLRALGRDFIEGKPILFGTSSDLPDELLSLTGVIESGLIVPLRYKGELLGAFTLISMDQNAFTEDDLSLATGQADLASVAIENAQLYEYERNIAETLQRSFLPSSLPKVAGYDIAAYYRPAMAEAEIGGDFYDIIIYSDGKIGIVVGDVSGKGLSAAVMTAMGKYMIRAYAVENPSPGNVMARFNRAFYENALEFSFITAFYGVLNPRNNIITYTSAGHDPPLLYSPETGQITHLSTGCLGLGIEADFKYSEKQAQLKPGDVLLLYTDGATDVKSNGGRLHTEGLERLFLSYVHESAEQIVNGISNGIWEYSHGHLSDDIVLVVLKRQDLSIETQ